MTSLYLHRHVGTHWSATETYAAHAQTAGIGFHKVMQRKKAKSPTISRDFKITTEGLRQSGSGGDIMRAGAGSPTCSRNRGAVVALQGL